MKICKKITSIVMLMIIFLSSIQSVIFGATEISSANLIKGDDIKTNVEFNDGSECFEIESSFVYYSMNGKKYPAYCVSHRARWYRGERQLQSKH